MLNEKMELQLKMLTIPLNDFSFYEKDIFEELLLTLEKSNQIDYFIKLLNVIYPIITRSNRVNNLDEVRLLAKKYYSPKINFIEGKTLPKNGISDFYLNHLSELSRLFITHRNGKISLKYWESKDEDNLLGPYKGIYKVALWNSLNRIITTDILVIIYLLNNEMTEEYYLRGYQSHVSLEDTELNQVMQKGVSETHMHFSAGGHFTLNWQNLMSPTRQHISKSMKDAYNYSDKLVGINFDLFKYTLSMASVRLLLGKFLQFKEENKESSGINLKSFYTKFYAEVKLSRNAIVTNDFLNDIANGEKLEKKDSYYYFELYEGIKDLFNIMLNIKPQTSSGSRYLASKDILHSVIKSYGEYTTVENVFLFKCLKYMKDREQPDSLFHKLFWQYIRIRNERFNQEIQKNSIKGLEYFKPFIERATDTVDIDDTEVGKWGLIMHNLLQNSNLRKLELRITVGKGNTLGEKIYSLKKKLKAFFKAYLQIIKDFNKEKRIAPQIGLLVHFIKEEDTFLLKCWREQKNLSYLKLQQKYNMEMQAVNNLREDIQGLSDYLVGLDAANLETNTEPWVFAPIYQKARDSSSHKLLYSNSLAKRIRNLGFTYHVGEDFRHMITGLRHIDEVIEQFQYHSGDRIGHGIVLGISPEKWAAKHKVVTLPQHEYLDNLLWIWGNYKENKYFNIYKLEQEIIRIAEKIYKNINGISVYILWKAYLRKFEDISSTVKESRGACSDIKQCPFNNNHSSSWTIDSLLLTLHCQNYIEELNKPIQINIEEEQILLICELQKIIKQKIVSKGIVVETNPSSNIAIGEIDHIFEHYITNLNGIEPKGNNIKVTINTDDPIVFNTSINNEFAYIFYSLLEKGYSREDVISWIEKIRENGLSASFIETREISNDDLYIEIEGILKKLDLN